MISLLDRWSEKEREKRGEGEKNDKEKKGRD
jgi:hypothetical protein